jgi:hypothetical protein
LLLQGSAMPARERLTVASDRLRQAGRVAGIAVPEDGGPPSTALTSTLLRLLAVASVQLGDRHTGRVNLTRALGAARERASQHDVMLALDALDWAGAAEAAEREEAARIRARLGVVWLPRPPLNAGSAAEGQIVVPEQRSPVEQRQQA